MTMMIITAAFLILVGFGVHASRGSERQMDMEAYNQSEYRVIPYRA